MYNVKQSPSWNDSIENVIRENFIHQITNYNAEKRNSTLTEMFINIFDEHSHSEEEFNNAILFTIDLLNNDESKKIGQIAIEFYEQNKNLLMPDISQQSMAWEDSNQLYFSDEHSTGQLATKAESSEEQMIPIQIEEETTTAPIKWQMKAVEQLITASSCPIDLEPMITAVTLACGHSFNQADTELLFGKLNTSGRCRLVPCPSCRTEVDQYTPNDLIRKVTAKVEKISASILPGDENKGLTAQQIVLVEELRALLICPATSRPLTQAVANSKGKYKYVNEEAIVEIGTPVFSLRDLAVLAQNITTGTL